MSARMAMTMRALHTRDVSTSDGGGGSTVTQTTINAALPCLAYLPGAGASLVIVGSEQTAVNDRTVLVPASADVRVGDTLTVTSKLGATLHGTLRVTGVSRRTDHLQLDGRQVA